MIKDQESKIARIVSKIKAGIAEINPSYRSGPDYYFYKKIIHLRQASENIEGFLKNDYNLEMLYATLVAWDMNSRADTNWELILPGSAVTPPVSPPPSTITGTVSPRQEQFTPSCRSAWTKAPTGLFDREGPATSRHLPGTSEQTAVINLRVAAD